MGCGASKKEDDTKNRDQDGGAKEKTDSVPTRKILIAGPPAGGKGTQCEYIVEKFGVVHISTGDLLRAEVKAESEEGKQADECMKNGQLVPDELIIRMVKNRLAQDDVQQKGWLLDGFPRTKAQGQALEEAGISPQILVLLEVPGEVLVERIEGRRNDPVTGKVYHLKFHPPPEDDKEVLDRLEQRADDTKEAIEKRLETYHANVTEILELYPNVVFKTDGNRDKQDVSKDVSAAIEAVVLEAKKEEEVPKKEEEAAAAPAPAEEEQKKEEGAPAEEAAAGGAAVVATSDEEKKEEEAPPAKKNNAERKTMWDELREKLPSDKKDKEQRKKRKEMFKSFDPNGNGYLSVAECDLGFRSQLQLDQLTDDLAPILMRAFNQAKGVRQSKGKGKKFGEDYVEKPEFRLLLLYLKQYFELWFMFDEIDSGDDRRVNQEEFNKAVAKLGEWGVAIDDSEAAFKEIDTNGGGIVLFTEFAEWAIKKGLDLEDANSSSEDKDDE